MPYITQPRREALIGGETPKNAGELNYVFTCIAVKYLKEHGGRYQQFNDIVGALEAAKLEFYRRMAAPYEDVKIQENGDVY